MEVGELIYKKNTQHGQAIETTLADPSCWIRNPISWRKEETQMYSDASIAHALQGSQTQPLVPNLVPANNDRINGWRNMAQLMKVTDKPPNFIIIKNCAPNLQRTIPEMIIDDKKPEDLDTTLEDHALDACRYALSHVQAPMENLINKTKDQVAYDKLLTPESENWTYTWRD